jgi:hypothetical protein
VWRKYNGLCIPSRRLVRIPKKATGLMPEAVPFQRCPPPNLSGDLEGLDTCDAIKSDWLPITFFKIFRPIEHTAGIIPG